MKVFKGKSCLRYSVVFLGNQLHCVYHFSMLAVGQETKASFPFDPVINELYEIKSENDTVN